VWNQGKRENAGKSQQTLLHRMEHRYQEMQERKRKLYCKKIRQEMHIEG